MRWVVCACGSLLLAAPAFAQAPAASSSTAVQEPAAPLDSQGPGGTPTIQFRGFADINFAATDNGRSDDGRLTDGFSLGYLVGHVSATLGGKFSFYAETTVAPRQASLGYFIDIARAILRYDYNDRFKISVGRYHAPVSYWNTAFHRGQWLQTAIFRPDIVKEQFYQPDSFLGVIAEGTLSSKAGVGYVVGYGNGREGDLLLAGDAGGNSRHEAWVAKLMSRPPHLTGVEFGGAVYHDVIAVAEIPGYEASIFSVPELITSGYVAITRETPEVIAEVSRVRHHDPRDGTNYYSHAFYVQAAYRLPAQPDWKPYIRFEKAEDSRIEPVFGDLNNSKTTVGIRYDLTDFAALKVEFGQRRRPRADHVNGVFAQTAFTF